MSGICAAVTFDGAAVDESSVRAMAAAAAHRGEGGVRTWAEPGAVLLEQHDRTPAGAPTASSSRPRSTGTARVATAAGVTVVADARLDQRSDLRAALERHGYPVDDRVGDAGLVLGAFRLWGRACTGRLIGDFAFVVWDARARVLFAARDAMGMRPLYIHARARRRLLLASEITQLLAAPGVPCEVFEPALAATLAGPYTPAPWTLYRGIDQLAPGHALVGDRQGIRTFAHWRPDPARTLDVADDAEAAALYRERLAGAVRDRMPDGATVGVMLSGGVDSTSIASTAGWLRERGEVGRATTLRTYSWAFDELTDSDERQVSAHVVARYGLAGSDVAADRWWPLAGHPAHGPDRDDPFVPVYRPLIDRTLAQCRRDGVTVQMVGDRGDELTGDWVYDEVGMATSGHPLRAVRDVRRAAAAAGMSTVAALTGAVAPTLRTRLPRVAARLGRGARNGPPWPPWIPDAFARRVDLGDIIAAVTSPPAFDGTARTRRYERIFHPQGARMAVAGNRARAQFGMSFVDPFTDRRLVELVLALPQWRVQRRGRSKALARSAMDGIVPPAALSGARKTIPRSLFDRGLRERAVDTVDELLTDPLAARHGWLDADVARAQCTMYRNCGSSTHDFWWPLTVEMWLRRWWSPAPGG